MTEDQSTFDWSSFEEVSEEEAPASLRPLLEKLDEMLRKDERLPQTLSQVLDETFRNPIDADTFGRLMESVRTLFGMGDDVSRLLAWLAFDHPAHVDATAPVAPAAAERLLRDVFAVYGQRLADAYRNWREIPDDWVTLSHQVQYEYETNQYVVGVGIEKLNGQTVWVRGSASSILALVSNLIRTLNPIAAHGPFDQARVEEFREAEDDLWKGIDAAQQAAASAHS
ncbi:MAG: hypothetical protein WB998_14440 [Solirubrobacteraceae bacterium]